MFTASVMRLMARLQATEFLINTYTSNSQYDPSVTALADGGFVVDLDE